MIDYKIEQTFLMLFEMSAEQNAMLPAAIFKRLRDFGLSRQSLGAARLTHSDTKIS